MARLTDEREVGYRGVSYPFRFGPTGGVVTSTTTIDDPRHIVESIRQIWECLQFEREMRPDFYGGLSRLPFEPMPETNQSVFHFILAKCIKRWDTRVEIRMLEIVKIVENTIIFNVEFYFKTTRKVIKETITLTR